MTSYLVEWNVLLVVSFYFSFYEGHRKFQQMDNANLPKEYFELLRKVMREKKNEQTMSSGNPTTRKRRKLRSNKSQTEDTSDDKGTHIETIDLTDHTSDSDKNNDYDDDDFNSDEFEDVVTQSASPIGDISVTYENQDTARANHAKLLKQKRQIARNICSNDEKLYRKSFHMLYLLCLLVHTSIRNQWINDDKLLKRLNKIVPDKILELLHPPLDKELPLRSTRKLLDGLKKCMELWNKHWKISKRYSNNNLGLYMQTWKEIHQYKNLNKHYLVKNCIDRKQFVKQIMHGMGNNDIATQGFVSLLRSCNLNARLVISCQPPDFTNLKESIDDLNTDSESMTKYPIFWCEVWDKFSKRWITIDPIKLKFIEQVKNASKLEPTIGKYCQRNRIRYVLAFDRKDGVRDVTRRYVRFFISKVRRKRITKDKDGEIWFNNLINCLDKRKRNKIDDYEELYFQKRDEDEGMPDNLKDFQNHPHYILEKDIRQNQILKPGIKECGYLKINSKVNSVLKVYEKKYLIDLKTARQWYNEGRILRIGAQCKKIIKKKSFKPTLDDSVEDERLYSIDDTELYDPPLATVPEGIIKKNTFGNIEVFTPNMIPRNCCLIVSQVAVKAARFIGIEFAPAVTQFKFERHKRVKPVVSGVVVANWFKDAVLAAIEGIEYSMELDEKKQREFDAMLEWNTLLTKLRIKSNLNETYGVVPTRDMRTEEEEEEEAGMGGGFFVQSSNTTEVLPPEDANYSEEEIPQGGFVKPAPHTSRPGEVADSNFEEPSDTVESLDDEYQEFMDDLGSPSN